MQENKMRFSDRVEDYVKYRPHYPIEIINFLKEKYGLTINKLIADVGAGTGISTEMFLKAGYPVVAVEPNREMREKAVELLGKYERVSVRDGAAEQTGLENESVDAIVCGQAFHWFDVGKTKEEFERVLKQDGIVVLIWNERKTDPGFEKEYDELIVKHARDYVKVDHRNIDTAHIAAFYSPQKCELKVFENKQVFDYEGLEGRLLSSSYMPRRTDEGYEARATELRALFDKYEANGKVTIYYDTKVYVGRLK